MTKDYDKIKKQLIEYYQDLLIVQYHDKPKAREVVKANIEEELCNLLEQKVKDAFDVDTAVGVQLDIIGKWVGIERVFKGQKYDNQAWFSLPRYNQETNLFMHGFSTYATFEEEGGFLTYDFILGAKNKLNDNDFRMLIKLKIIRNNIPHSPKPIDDAMYKLFADTLYTVWNEMVYNSDAFTVVGSPTITSDGVASGFTKDDYINTVYAWSPSNNIWEIRIKCKTPNTLPSPNPTVLIGSSTKTDKKVPRIGIQQNGRWIWSIPNDTGTAWQKEYWGTLDVAKLNTDYYFKMYFTGTAYKLDYSLDDKTWNNMASFQSTMPVYNLGAPIGLGGDLITFNWTGSIDLTGFKIYINGKDVLSGGYNQPMEMTFYYNPKRYGIVKLGQEKNCFPIPTGVKANFVEVKR